MNVLWMQFASAKMSWSVSKDLKKLKDASLPPDMVLIRLAGPNSDAAVLKAMLCKTCWKFCASEGSLEHPSTWLVSTLPHRRN
jgi:hypothetical protein